MGKEFVEAFNRFFNSLDILKQAWVIPCEHCKYFGESDTDEPEYHECKYFTNIDTVIWVEDDDFCSFAERKDEVEE